MKKILIIGIAIILTTSCGRTKKEYYRSGELKAEFQKDKKGLKQNELIRYYKNGQIESKEYYLNDTLNGTFENFYLNGNLKTKAMFIMGLQEGELVEYYLNSNIKQRANYLHGLSNGLNEFFHENGKISTIAILKNDTTEYFISFDSLGNMTEKRHSMYLEILSSLNRNDSVKIRQRVPGFIADNMNPIYALIEKYGTIKEGDVPKMKLNPLDSMYYITFPPQKDTGKYVIKTFFHALPKFKFKHENDTVITIK